MKIIYKVKIFFKKLKFNKKRLEKMVKSFPLEMIEETLELPIDRTSSEIVNVSEKLKKFLNAHILYEENILREIRKCDIQEIIELIRKRNQTRTNILRIEADVADEFISIIEQEANEEKFVLGELEIDISNKQFKIKEFVDKHNKITYILKLKICSIDDLKNEDFNFLSSRYGIMYIYAEEEYHLDELLKIIDKLKEFIPENNKTDLKSAQNILDTICNRFELYKPKEYVMKQKSVKLINGENLNLPNFKVLENTSYYSSIRNVFIEEKASEKGFRRICIETLKLANFNVINNIESFTNTIKKPDLIIDDIKYQIVVNADSIELVE